MLRAIRFKTLLNFEIEGKCLSEFERFDLSELSKHYFLYEGFKSKNFFSFLGQFFKVTDEFKISLPDKISSFSFLRNFEAALTRNAKNLQETIYGLLSGQLLERSQFEMLSELFDCKESYIKNMATLIEVFENWDLEKMNYCLDIIHHGPAEALKCQSFEQVFEAFIKIQRSFETFSLISNNLKEDFPKAFNDFERLKWSDTSLGKEAFLSYRDSYELSTENLAKFRFYFHLKEALADLF